MDALCCEAGPRFCKGDSETLDPDVRAFLRYVDGKAAEGKFMKAVEDEVMRVKEHTQGNEARIYDVRNGNQTA